MLAGVRWLLGSTQCATLHALHVQEKGAVIQTLLTQNAAASSTSQAGNVCLVAGKFSQEHHSPDVVQPQHCCSQDSYICICGGPWMWWPINAELRQAIACACMQEQLAGLAKGL